MSSQFPTTVFSKSAPLSIWERILLILGLAMASLWSVISILAPMNMYTEGHAVAALITFATICFPLGLSAIGMLFLRPWGFWILLGVTSLSVYGNVKNGQMDWGMTGFYVFFILTVAVGLRRSPGALRSAIEAAGVDATTGIHRAAAWYAMGWGAFVVLGNIGHSLLAMALGAYLFAGGFFTSADNRAPRRHILVASVGCALLHLYRLIAASPSHHVADVVLMMSWAVVLNLTPALLAAWSLSNDAGSTREGAAGTLLTEGKQMCAYCRSDVPSGEDTCPSCSAPVQRVVHNVDQGAEDVKQIQGEFFTESDPSVLKQNGDVKSKAELGARVQSVGWLPARSIVIFGALFFVGVGLLVTVFAVIKGNGMPWEEIIYEKKPSAFDRLARKLRPAARAKISTTEGLRTVALGCEAFGVDFARYPSANRIDELRPLMTPNYINPQNFPTYDGFGNPYGVVCNSSYYLVGSAGPDGVGGTDDDISYTFMGGFLTGPNDLTYPGDVSPNPKSY